MPMGEGVRVPPPIKTVKGMELKEGVRVLPLCLQKDYAVTSVAKSYLSLLSFLFLPLVPELP